MQRLRTHKGEQTHATHVRVRRMRSRLAQPSEGLANDKRFVLFSDVAVQSMSPMQGPLGQQGRVLTLIKEAEDGGGGDF